MAHDASFGIFKVFESDVRVIRKKEKLLLKLVLNRKWAHVFMIPCDRVVLKCLFHGLVMPTVKTYFKKAACILILSFSYFIKVSIKYKTISLLAC